MHVIRRDRETLNKEQEEINEIVDKKLGGAKKAKKARQKLSSQQGASQEEYSMATVAQGQMRCHALLVELKNKIQNCKRRSRSEKGRRKMRKRAR